MSDALQNHLSVVAILVLLLALVLTIVFGPLSIFGDDGDDD